MQGTYLGVQGTLSGRAGGPIWAHMGPQGVQGTLSGRAGDLSGRAGGPIWAYRGWIWAPCGPGQGRDGGYVAKWAKTSSFTMQISAPRACRGSYLAMQRPYLGVQGVDLGPMWA